MYLLKMIFDAARAHFEKYKIYEHRDIGFITFSPPVMKLALLAAIIVSSISI